MAKNPFQTGLDRGLKFDPITNKWTALDGSYMTTDQVRNLGLPSQDTAVDGIKLGDTTQFSTTEVPRIEVPTIYSNLSNSYLNEGLNSAIFKNSHNGFTPAQFAKAPYSDAYKNSELGKYNTGDTSYETTGGADAGSSSHDWNYQDYGTAAGAGLGIANLALKIFDYPSQRAYREKVMQGLDQRYAINDYTFDTLKKHNNAVNKGLAAASATKVR